MYICVSKVNKSSFISYPKGAKKVLNLSSGNSIFTKNLCINCVYVMFDTECKWESFFITNVKSRISYFVSGKFLLYSE